MLDTKSKAVGLLVLLGALAVPACGSDDDKSNPVPVAKDAGPDAPADAKLDAKPDAPSEGGSPADAGVDSADAASE